jgi:hypothetical protein
MNWTGYVRKWPTPKLRYYPIFLAGGKPPETSVRIIVVQAKN